ncbi:MAG: putative nicotinate-nucleotide adenylyltransferase [Candidatus Marinimicrobia bacterium]|nr:putative nicotinate-nucleotide adenylyltransferase [Candidatus Neomarinimicrobiota bacterium]
MGGTFDPPHWGHVLLAEFVRTKLSVETFSFVPAYLPPHKQQKAISNVEHRIRMLELICDDHEPFQIDTREIERQGVSYTVDTLRAVVAENDLNKNDIGLLIGADNFVDFQNWKAPETIVDLCRVLVVKRSDFPLSRDLPFYHRVELIDAPVIEISGRQVRDRLRKAQSIKYFVLPQIESYIQSQNLYR